MKSLTLCLLFVALTFGFTFGKTAEDYLHGAAYKYIAGRMQEAGVEAEEGLRAYPDDPKLRNLDDLLKQMKDQQRQDQNQSGGSDSKDKQNKDKKDSKDQKDQKGQGKDSQNQDKDSQKNDSDKGQNQKDSSGQDKNKEQPQPKPGEKNSQSPKDTMGQGGQPKRMPGQMSKEEAERLLNSFVDEEKKTQENRQPPRKRSESNQEDW